MQVNFILRTVGTSKGRYVGFLFLMFWVSKSTAAMMCYLPVFTGKAQRLSIFLQYCLSRCLRYCWAKLEFLS